MTDKRKAFEKKLDAQIKEWNAEIDLLKAKADTTKAESEKAWAGVKNAFHDAAAKFK